MANKNREVILTFRVSKRERELLDELARESQCSRSELIRSRLLVQHDREGEHEGRQ